MNESFVDGSLIVSGEKIHLFGNPSSSAVSDLDCPVLSCANCYVVPAFIDPHCHLSGGSGERGGFHSQSFPLTVAEFIRGGITTTVGTLGVDTTTKTMPDLLAKVKSFNQAGMTAYCYVGGYDCPPKTMTDSVRNDVIFIPEIIGVGEIAIADRRAPEPTAEALARASIDSYVGGLLSAKPGLTHFHAGPSDRRLQSIFDLLKNQSIVPQKISVTHISRSQKLMEEAVTLARLGCYVDIDLWDDDFAFWYQVYKDLNGPMNQLTVSTDAGVSSPEKMWDTFRQQIMKHKTSIEELLPFFTSNTARALHLPLKGLLQKGADADLLVIEKKSLEIRHVISKGHIMLQEGSLTFSKGSQFTSRGIDIYGIQEKENQEST